MDLAQLRHNFEIRDFQTGRALQQRQHVQDLTVTVQSPEPIHVQLRGSVAARQDTYYPQVNLRWTPTRIDADGECDCGGYNCGHIAALAIHYLVQVQLGHLAHPNPEQSLQAWLAQLTDQPTELSYQLVFSLHSSHDGLALQALVQKRKQNGSWGKRLQTVTEPLLEACQLSDLDLQLLALLNEYKRLQFDRRSSRLLEGRKGALLLKLVSQHPRVVWQGQPTSVAFLEALSPNWHWQSYGQGYRLESAIAAHWQLTNTYPVYAYDEQAKQVIPLAEQRSYAQLQALRQAPLVPSDKLLWLKQHLPTSLANIELPELRPMQRLADCQFVPALHISRKHPSAPGHMIARLSAHYADFSLTINGEQISRIEQDDRIIELVRDRPAEQQAIDTLLALGLYLTEFNGEVVFWHQPPNTPEDSHYWQEFVTEKAPRLQAQGWQLHIEPNAYQFRLTDAKQVNWHLNETSNGWFDLTISFRQHQHSVALLPVLQALLSQPELMQQDTIHWQLDGSTIEIATHAIRPVVNTLREIAQQSRTGGARIARNQLPLLTNMSSQLIWQGKDRLSELQQQLSSQQPAKVSAGLTAELRGYQLDGVQWLQRLERAGFNALLADDMGLGKTLQVIAHILSNEHRKLPSLVIAPTSLLSNWRQELATFAPQLKVATWHGGARERLVLGEQDIVITTYTMARVDGERLAQQGWHYLVIDEAQQVKNHRSQAARSLRTLQAKQMIALSGTPVENHLKELWAIFDLLEPGLLGGQRQFSQFFVKPIKAGESEAWEALQQRIRPFMLRRSKADVASSLPAKTKMVRYVSLDTEQADLYESIRLSMQAEVSKILTQQGDRGQLRLLDALLKLRQVCCHPQLINLPSAQRVEQSAKLDYLLEMVGKLVEDGRKVLVFSQFAKMLAVIAERLTQRNIGFSLLTGASKDRDSQIDQFKTGKVDVFLISLKAGGVGLNLTEADTVIHYDPWWNPASEAQASDRVHRIGQDKPVFIYKLIVEHSVEDRILAMQQQKQQLADQLYNQSTNPLDPQSLDYLLQPLQAADG